MLSWFKRFFRRKKLSPLKQELRNLRRNIQRTENYLSAIDLETFLSAYDMRPFNATYTREVARQTRRNARVQQILDKLERDSRVPFLT